ncbi:MAG: VWA domain-containing protein, partial [Planctomycetaceae bacterium]|nr:VWA domain-containing protein [Planctomycetaceae bacterium]
MINSQQEGLYRLNSNSGEQIALKSVEIIGQVEGWILTKTLRQKYQNNTDETLEVSYAFPVSYGEVLLAMNVTLDDKKLAAKVIERKRANEQYEDAIEKGDTPIMVELNDESGIATVNLGNLKPNAIAELEIVSAIPLRFAQGKIRFALPATIAPRYGDPIKDGGMREHDAVNVDAGAEYPLTIRIELQDAAAHAAVSSPSHAIKMKQEHEKTIVTLAKAAFLDRDFILILDDIKETSTTLIAPDENEFMTQTTFYAPIANNTDPIFLKILVDCSGSMGGDSIAVAKRALKRIAAELTDKDFITYSRFGSSVEHKFSTPTRCSADVLKKLNFEIDQTDANLGGTEMERALLDVFKLSDKKQDAPSAQVLLITDGEVWNSAGVTNSAKISGHRVFVVGVGASSAEHTLNNLAKETGGAYESISPNESGAEVITRSFYKMRGGELRDVKIKWDKKPLWESELPKIIYCGETLRVFAQFQSPPEKPPVLSYVIATEKKELTSTTFAKTDNPIITKLGGAKKYDDTQSHESKLELSLRYQLL